MVDYPRLRLPRPDRIPSRLNLRQVPKIDTGAAFRPDWREQDPAKDPKEPYGNESSGTGNDHAWSNCTMVSAALAFAYATQDQSGPHGGDMRHNQSDREGGTDLYDADEAFNNLGQNLDIRIGQGWADLKAKRAEGRAIVIQGEGNVPGSESFDGGHACIIGPETNTDGKWLFGDPLASGWQWVSESAIRDWAENLSSAIYYACTKKHEGGSIVGTYLADVKAASGTVVMQADGPCWRVVDDARVEAKAGATWETTGTALYHFDDDHPNGSLGRMIRARAEDGELHIVANSRVTFTPASTGGDCSDEIAQRDAEWLAHLTPDA